MTVDEQEKGPKYFNLERFLHIYRRTSKPASGFSRAVARVTGVIDSLQGFLVVLMFLPIMFGTLLAVILGAYYGPWAFLGIFGSIIGGLAFFAERKIGRSMQFGEYGFFTRTLGTALAFLVALGIIFFMIYASKL